MSITGSRSNLAKLSKNNHKKVIEKIKIVLLRHKIWARWDATKTSTSVIMQLNAPNYPKTSFGLSNLGIDNNSKTREWDSCQNIVYLLPNAVNNGYHLYQSFIQLD